MNLRPELQMELKSLIREYKTNNKTELLSYQGVFYPDFANDFVETVRSVKKQSPNFNTITVILNSLGGYSESVSPMVRALMLNYDYIKILVPTKCASSATAFALSANEILVNPYSRFGPIDSSLPLGDGTSYPVTLKWMMYYEALKKAEDKRDTSDNIILQYDRVEIDKYKKADEWLLKDIIRWMSVRMFKDIKNKDEIIKNLIHGQRGLMNIKYWSSHEADIYPSDLEEICPELNLTDYEKFTDYKLLNEIIHRVEIGSAKMMNRCVILTEEIFVSKRIPASDNGGWGYDM